MAKLLFWPVDRRVLVARRQPITGHLAIIKPRARIASITVAVLYFLLAGRLVYLQADRHRYFQKQADEYRVVHEILPAFRGRILDRNNVVLAMDDTSAWAIFADPHMVTQPAEEAQALAPFLGIDAAHLQMLLTPRNLKTRYVSLKRHATDGLGPKIKALNLPGIGVIRDTRRIYPNHTLAAQILGFTDVDGNGIEGLEQSQNSLLQAQDGLQVAEVDSKGEIIPGTDRPGTAPHNGDDLVLTIDSRLQYVADQALQKDVAAHHAEWGVAIVLNPWTGGILALSNAPTYDPNHPHPDHPLDLTQALALESKRRDYAVSNLYEPGSTLKAVTASAILQEQGLGMMSKYVDCTPTLRVGRYTIHEAADGLTGHLGEQTLRGVLRVSSNVGMAQFGLGLGAPRLYEYEKKFGFLDKPDSGLPGEAWSWLASPAKYNPFTEKVGWPPIELANISFGQGISVTPLQLTMAYGAIANGGILMQPRIIHAIRTNDLERPVPPVEVRRVISPQVAAAVRSILGTVVQSGTGQSAQIADYTVGGKTGSAQVAGAHGYEPGAFDCSFVGIYPLKHPRLVIFCTVFKPTVGAHWGATVAAPVVHDIARYAMMEMHIPPDDPQAVDWDNRFKVASR
jgi:stage V sporulation protein D (sporulation-specific penicillin-binding protein)